MIKFLLRLSILLMFLASCSNGIKKDIPTSSPVKTVAPIEAVQSEPVSIKTPIGDGGIITGYPCVAPCFIGIYPGKTQFDEAISTLAKTDVGDCKKMKLILLFRVTMTCF